MAPEPVSLVVPFLRVLLAARSTGVERLGIKTLSTSLGVSVGSPVLLSLWDSLLWPWHAPGHVLIRLHADLGDNPFDAWFALQQQEEISKAQSMNSFTICKHPISMD